MAKNRKIVIGTRGSKLALWQAGWVKAALERLHPGIEVVLNRIKTTGDKILDVPLAKVGGKGLFVKEIEDALLKGEADIAVHSMKDVPTSFPEGLHLSAICKREDPRDAFISRITNQQSKIKNFVGLPQGAVIGTSSLRRSCQLLNVRPDLKIEQLRGNLDTRFRKLDEGRFDGIILAAAGIKRLGWADRITEVLPIGLSLPAVGQGAIGIECRTGDDMDGLVAPLDDTETSICVKAERAFLKRLGGGCQVPIAAYARIEIARPWPGEKTGYGPERNVAMARREEESEIGNPTSGNINLQSATLVMKGLVGNFTGDSIIRNLIEGSPADSESLGIALAERMLSRGAKEILDEVYRKCAPAINGDIAS